jgi:cell division protease FtsH
MPTPETPGPKGPPHGDTPRVVWLRWLVLFLVVGGLLVQTGLAVKRQPGPVAYSQLRTMVEEGKVVAADITDSVIRAELAREEGAEGAPRIVSVSRVPGVDDDAIVERLIAQGAVVRGHEDSGGFFRDAVFFILPFLLIAAFWIWGLRRMSSAGSGPMQFGRSKARLQTPETKIRVRFTDVAGVEEAKAELTEVVDFLMHPGKYQALGARIPRGVLLVGPPGTGKTLLARAVAGEAGVPFYNLSGSEFVEMFVGVGAARVRDLFAQAKEHAPCIVFIDELDAIGKSRGGLGAVATHDEREQTLNQLLTEMDGFEATQGVIIMAATNRPEVLDQALLRAGRFDRQVLLDRPDLRSRHQILKVHARRVRLGDDVDLEVVARRTPGMAGADLANIVNESALAAARRGSDCVTSLDFEEAVDRVQLGLKKQRSVMREEEKRRVAYHESGHALVAMNMPRADPVHRVTIIPRTIGALGATLQLPTEERFLVTQTELEDRIAVMLGGRVAEAMIYSEVSTGAQNDLERATETARQMICRFGMSDAIGPITLGQPMGLRYLDVPVSYGNEQNFSEATAQLVDREVRRIVETGESRARKVLEARKVELRRVVERLLAKETLDREELESILASSRALKPVQRPDA